MTLSNLDRLDLGSPNDQNDEVSSQDSYQAEKTIRFKLTFTEFQNEMEELNFITFVFNQEKNPENTKLLIYDIYAADIVKIVDMCPEHEKYLLEDRFGYNKYQIVKSSDTTTLEASTKKFMNMEQKVKF